MLVGLSSYFFQCTSCGAAPKSNQIGDSHCLFSKKKLMSLMSLEVVLKCKLYFVQMVYFRAFQLLHQNVNIIVSHICVTCAMKSVSFVFRLGKECIVYCINV